MKLKFLASTQRRVFYFPIARANKYLQYQQLKLYDTSSDPIYKRNLGTQKLMYLIKNSVQIH